MPVTFSTFLAQINDAVLAENGNNLAYLLRPTSPQGKDLVKEFRNPTVSLRPISRGTNYELIRKGLHSENISAGSKVRSPRHGTISQFLMS